MLLLVREALYYRDGVNAETYYLVTVLRIISCENTAVDGPSTGHLYLCSPIQGPRNVLEEGPKKV